MQYASLPFDDKLNSFMTAREVLDYLEAYKDRCVWFNFCSGGIFYHSTAT